MLGLGESSASKKRDISYPVVYFYWLNLLGESAMVNPPADSTILGAGWVFSLDGWWYFFCGSHDARVLFIDMRVRVNLCLIADVFYHDNSVVLLPFPCCISIHRFGHTYLIADGFFATTYLIADGIITTRVDGDGWLCRLRWFRARRDFGGGWGAGVAF